MPSQVAWHLGAPTSCSMLFDNSPLGMSGVEILNGYVVFRRGEGVTHGSNVKPCENPTTGAWTTCCNHDRVIFLCDRFAGFATSFAATLLIHEGLHVAGQLEDTSPSTGPGDPPTAGQLTSAVEAACSDPMPFY